MKRHIIFDAGGVLFYINEFRNNIIRRILSCSGYTTEQIDDALARLVYHDQEYFNDNDIVTWEDEKKWLISRAKHLCSSIENSDDELRDKIYVLSFDTFQYHLYDETIRTLELLKKDYTLHVLSNATATLDWAFDLLGIRKYFENVIISSYTGYAKPDEKIYEFAIEQINQNRDNCIFIDDKVENIIASRDCGIESYHLDRKEGKTLKDFVIYLKEKNGIGV